MFSAPNKDQAASLAGVFQSAMLVSQLANQNEHDEVALRNSALSILRIEADSVIEVYGSMTHLRLGFNVMERLFQGNLGNSTRDLFQYSVSMHQLAGRLAGMTAMTDAVHSGLADINQRYPDADLVDHQKEQEEQEEWLLYEDIASLYAKTISTLTPRIMVRGSEGRLSDPRTVNRVRTALFSGIRSAFLWQQLGGQRWHLVLHRKSYRSLAKKLGRV